MKCWLPRVLANKHIMFLRGMCSIDESVVKFTLPTISDIFIEFVLKKKERETKKEEEPA